MDRVLELKAAIFDVMYEVDLHNMAINQLGQKKDGLLKELNAELTKVEAAKNVANSAEKSSAD